MKKNKNWGKLKPITLDKYNEKMDMLIKKGQKSGKEVDEILTDLLNEAAKITLIGWTKIIRGDGRTEYNCEHGIGHGEHPHGCDGCCSNKDYPGRKNVKKKVKKSNN